MYDAIDHEILIGRHDVKWVFHIYHIDRKFYYAQRQYEILTLMQIENSCCKVYKINPYSLLLEQVSILNQVSILTFNSISI